MAKNKLVLLLAAGLIALGSCKKETTKDVSTTLKVPTIEINGGDFITVPVGSAYADAGATFTDEDGTTKTLAPAEGSVSTTAPGVYFITYRQASKSGIFNTEAIRVVGVGAYTANPKDYSGVYLRAATGQSAILTRVSPGFYRVQNPGGAPGHGSVVVYFIETALNTFEGPLQEESGAHIGPIQITDISINDAGGSWRILQSPYYGTGLRSFVKQ